MTTRDAITPASAERRRAKHLRSALGAVLCASACLAIACGARAEAPFPVPLGKEIAVGPYSLRLLRATPTPNPPPPISTFRSQPGKRGIVVFVMWKNLDAGMDDLRRIAFVEKFLEANLSVVDGDGNRIRPTSAMQQRLMFMQDPGPNWRDWVVVFHVPSESRDLSVVVHNPEPRNTQARATATRLEL